MKQIYINTMLGTTRIDYDPNDPRDIIIVARSATVESVHRDNIECTNIQPDEIETFHSAKDEMYAFAQSVLEHERRMALYSDEGPNERYLRDLMGDDAYENWEIQD